MIAFAAFMIVSFCRAERERWRNCASDEVASHSM
jgi:hypothetical protein